MLTQEWLYTAITRARNNVYIVCNDRGLSKALSRQVIVGKTLKEKIASYVIASNSDYEMGFDTQKYPILWEPEVVR
jgi:ATP-dependent exoDNAse (exonuclease V) alpha subunit